MGQTCQQPLGQDNELTANDVLDHLQDQLDALRHQSGARQGRQAFRKVSSEAELARLVEEILKSRRRRATHFDAALFGEPAWDMLLEAYAAEFVQIRLSTTKLCFASAVPQSTALRWLAKLVDEGWLERTPDRFDVRRSWISLTPKGRAAMVAYLRDLAVRPL